MSRNLPALIPATTVDHFGGQERLDLIRDQIAKGTSDGEFALFLAVCERTGLDPFARQIYAIMRGGKMTVQTGIDGFRAVADRSSRYAGQDRARYAIDEDGDRYAEVVVYKMVDGVRCPFPGVAYESEFAQPGSMWQKMPKNMLAKCAEAQALRKAFPSQLGGVYTHEEMVQADHDQDPWRPYRDSLIARARALPESVRAALRGTHPDPRTSTPDELAAFERAVAAAEDDVPVVAELVDDDGGLPATAGESGEDGPPLSSPHPATLDDVTRGGDPVTPQDIAKLANYRREQAAKRSSREAVDQQLAEADA